MTNKHIVYAKMNVVYDKYGVVYVLIACNWCKLW